MQLLHIKACECVKRIMSVNLQMATLKGVDVSSREFATKTAANLNETRKLPCILESQFF
jgi:hypothetical protein